MELKASMPCTHEPSPQGRQTWAHTAPSRRGGGGSCDSSPSLRAQMTFCHLRNMCQAPRAGQPLDCPAWGWEGSQNRRAFYLSSIVENTWSRCNPGGEKEKKKGVCAQPQASFLHNKPNSGWNPREMGYFRTGLGSSGCFLVNANVHVCMCTSCL